MEPPRGCDDVTAHLGLHFLLVPSSCGLTEAPRLPRYILCHLAMDQYVCNESNKYQGGASTACCLLGRLCMSSHQHNRAARQLASSTLHARTTPARQQTASSTQARHEQVPISTCCKPSTTECLSASASIEPPDPTPWLPRQASPRGPWTSPSSAEAYQESLWR